MAGVVAAAAEVRLDLVRLVAWHHLEGACSAAGAELTKSRRQHAA